MMELSTKIQSIFHVHDGLCDGLSHFSGPSRAALIYAAKPDSPPRIYDPQRLLEGHEPMLEKHYVRSNVWRNRLPEVKMRLLGQIFPEPNLHMTGLICCGGKTGALFYQMWFTEHHATMCSTGPAERWLEHAACLLAHDWANEEWFFTRNSQYVLREYATHAVRDYIRDEIDTKFSLDSRMEVYPILDTVLGISKTREEGAWPRGTLVFIDPGKIPEVPFLLRFPQSERLRLANFKHVRKLILAVENSERRLVSDGHDIIGIAQGPMPACRITADFRGGYGFLRFGGKLVCSFADGSYHSTDRRPNLVQLEELLIGASLDAGKRDCLYKITRSLVENAGAQRHGATIVLDLGEKPIAISGQRLAYPIDLQDGLLLDLAKSLSRVDGAVHIGADAHLHAFACILDGRSCLGESRARGARFNSALRFTAENPNIIVVVVSVDRPVSVLHKGVDLTARPEWEPVSQLLTQPITLEEWLISAREQELLAGQLLMPRPA